MHNAVADLLRLAIAPEWIWWHTPNGEGRSKAAAGRLKKMGTKPGVSDILLLSPDGRLHALELKAKGKKPTDTQKTFMCAVVKAGGEADWTDSLDGALEILHRWRAIKGVML
jgi:hypothetical protein